jgi:ZIP family zinc transporter
VPPVEKLVVERAVLGSQGIQLTVLNDGPDPVTIAQVTVDDAYWAFTARDNRTHLAHLGRTKLDIPYPWVAGEAHLIKVMTSTGTTFEHEIPVAVRTPSAEPKQLAAFTLIGLYVGVIPVALGLMWFPLVSRLGRTGLDVLLAVTLGLLLFLLIDTGHEGIETAGALPASYQGLALFLAAALGAYLVLESFGAWLRRRRSAAGSQTSKAWVLSLLVATGIGLHNFGEGLAIGAAFALGEAALGTLLVIGFTLHNTTEGLAIVAPLARERPTLAQLARLGAIGGLPTIAGAWAGGIVYSPVLAVLFLGFGAGAIAQVLLQIARQMADTESIAVRFSSPPVMGGLAAGFLIMLATGMLVG